ncbi:unnamed protein product [Nippostrongylus brasiliensis]|uniref:Uncharacterized protein n=1 Tax=Nippostrongylus brasiliensis TaxID=27835 RepID=A0A0N4YHB7_NIPBR|nr:unnamed protein product [Nippostrongylus brasiliensis]
MSTTTIELSLSRADPPHQQNNRADLRADRSVLLSSSATMGTSLSTPSPVRALITQFDRLELCSKDKKKQQQSEELADTEKATVITQPTSNSTAASISTDGIASKPKNSVDQSEVTVISVESEELKPVEVPDVQDGGDTLPDDVKKAGRCLFLSYFLCYSEFSTSF